MINAIIVEDSPLAQKFLSDLLEREGDFCLAGCFADAFQAEERCAAGGVDLVLMDVQTQHNHSGLAAGERIRALGGGRTRVVAVTSLVDPAVIARARAGGADSLWYKDHGGADLLDVIRRTLAGERVFPDSAPSIELGDMFSGDISPRQMAILRRFVQGMTYDEIAGELNLTKDGVRWNIGQLIEKGGFANKYELMTAVVQSKLVVTTLQEK